MKWAAESAVALIDVEPMRLGRIHEPHRIFSVRYREVFDQVSSWMLKSSSLSIHTCDDIQPALRATA